MSLARKPDPIRTIREWHEKPTLWYVVELHGELDYGVQHMTHDEIVESILSDLLDLHFGGLPQGCLWWELFRFVKSSRETERVLDALFDPRIWGVYIVEDGVRLRLRPERELLQGAMDIAGVWFHTHGYEPPEGVEALRLAPEVEEELEVFGHELGMELILKRLEPDLTRLLDDKK